ncbi:outer membrane protein transport protein [Craterilacuibacter sp. RT1T]|uniref:OmpP1/FadL family transporter n=1 Tax=Craterilacuibacter sp. RT1T TaxID=2942211 RepID=UPI0020BDE831|nr:outer membrane protein transport protein [Craterilacuibacter sp. RT1T]MCL6262503.1 outer membrane protein transport protein [Craterilacuibacter sp. RT1T]
MTRFNRTSLLIAALFAAAPAVHAAGFQLSEQSIVGLGRAHAGAGVAGDDLSAVFYNPAGMMLLNGTQVQGGFTYAEIDAPFEGVTTKGKRFTENGRAGGEAIPNAFFVHEINERTRFGFGVTVPFGLGSGYGENWGGRNDGIEAHIMTVDLNPSLAYQLNDKLSIGGGVSAQYTKANLKKGALGSASGEIEADSWDYGYNLGLMYQFNADSRVGLSYRSKIQHEPEGDYTVEGLPAFTGLNGVYGGSTRVTTPESILLSGYHRIDPKLALTGSLRWSNWSRYETLVIENDSGKPVIGEPSIIPNNWKASWFASVGADYNYSDKLTLRGGVAYETSPVPDAEHRNPLIPDTDRVWLSLGASYQVDKALTVDAGYTYLMGVGDRDINAKSFQGSYSSITGHLIGVGMQYRF